MKRTSASSPVLPDNEVSSTGVAGGAKFAGTRTEKPVSGTVHVVDDDAAVRDSLACLLTDIRMPGLDGLGLQRRLAELGLDVAVVVMSGHADVSSAVAAMKAGAVDFLQKPFAETTLLAVVRQALERQSAAAAEVEAAATAAARLASLTPREHEVLAQLVAGHANKVIAQVLGASPRTIEVHRARVMEKLGVRSLPDLVRLVLAAG